jgi:hypothetical protein
VRVTAGPPDPDAWIYSHGLQQGTSTHNRGMYATRTANMSNSSFLWTQWAIPPNRSGALVHPCGEHLRHSRTSGHLMLTNFAMGDVDLLHHHFAHVGQLDVRVAPLRCPGEGLTSRSGVPPSPGDARTGHVPVQAPGEHAHPACATRTYSRVTQERVILR